MSAEGRAPDDAPAHLGPTWLSVGVAPRLGLAALLASGLWALVGWALA